MLSEKNKKKNRTKKEESAKSTPPLKYTLAKQEEEGENAFFHASRGKFFDPRAVFTGGLH